MQLQPPRTWTASRAEVTAASEAYSLAMAASRLDGWPASSRAAARCQARRAVGLDLHVGDLEGDRLEAGDRLAERPALVGVPGALVDAAPAQAGGKGGHGDAAVLEARRKLARPLLRSPRVLATGTRAALEDQLAGVGGVPADLA